MLDGVAAGLPGLTRAAKLQRRAARVGFDWPEALQVLDKIEEEIVELKQEIRDGSPSDRVTDELGDLLFALGAAAHRLGVDAEQALRGANARFATRFGRVEAEMRERRTTLAEVPTAEKLAAWERAKAAT